MTYKYLPTSYLYILNVSDKNRQNKLNIVDETKGKTKKKKKGKGQDELIENV